MVSRELTITGFVITEKKKKSKMGSLHWGKKRGPLSLNYSGIRKWCFPHAIEISNCKGLQEIRPLILSLSQDKIMLDSTLE